jgi:hypothetical protein
MQYQDLWTNTENRLLSESEIQIQISVHNMAQWLSMRFDIAL